MAFSRHTVGDQSPSDRLCLYPDSGSLTRARNLSRGSHLDVLSAFRPCGRDLAEFFNSTGWASYGQVTPWLVQRPNATGYLTLPQTPLRASGMSSIAMKALGGNGLSRERAFSAEKPKRG